jgi:hypothetical protein
MNKRAVEIQVYWNVLFKVKKSSRHDLYNKAREFKIQTVTDASVLLAEILPESKHLLNFVVSLNVEVIKLESGENQTDTFIFDVVRSRCLLCIHFLLSISK